ncbi:MAG: hypothetical protein SGJ27_24805 [Candidatus Melainabacteria bacterium]|nr:hypothetical protein [Candidatus Melainabacteria bacterium]
MLFNITVNDDNFPMAGTEGTNTYVVPLKTDKGSLGYRPDTARGVYRVRVEPSSQEVVESLSPSFPDSDWKQPGDGDEPRFSIVIPIDDKETLLEVLTTAAAALKKDSAWVRGNIDTPEFAYALATPECEVEEREQLTAQLRRIKVQGVNKRWKLTTLARKVNEERARMIAEVVRRKLPDADKAAELTTDELLAKLTVQKQGDS